MAEGPTKMKELIIEQKEAHRKMFIRDAKAKERRFWKSLKFVNEEEKASNKR